MVMIVFDFQFLVEIFFPVAPLSLLATWRTDERELFSCRNPLSFVDLEGSVMLAVTL